MSQACNLIISATLQGKEEDDKLKAWLGYRISSQPAWVTWHDPILGKRKESKEKERENWVGPGSLMPKIPAQGDEGRKGGSAVQGQPEISREF